jgi:hypothetical protein
MLIFRALYSPTLKHAYGIIDTLLQLLWLFAILNCTWLAAVAVAGGVKSMWDFRPIATGRWPWRRWDICTGAMYLYLCARHTEFTIYVFPFAIDCVLVLKKLLRANKTKPHFWFVDCCFTRGRCWCLKSALCLNSGEFAIIWNWWRAAKIEPPCMSLPDYRSGQCFVGGLASIVLTVEYAPIDLHFIT